MTFRLLNNLDLEFLSLKRSSTGSSESTLVKMPHYWKSHVTAHVSVSNTGKHQFSANQNFYQLLNKDRSVPDDTYLIEGWGAGKAQSVVFSSDWLDTSLRRFESH